MKKTAMAFLAASAILGGMTLQSCSRAAVTPANNANVALGASETDKLIPIPASVAPGGDCAIDTVDSSAPDAAKPNLKVLLVRGWAAVSGKDGTLGDATYVSITPQGEAASLAGSHRLMRQDVAGSFHQASLLGSGFYSVIDVSALHGKLQLRVVQEKSGQYTQCARPPVIVAP
jgi:hypothetical protein